MLVTRQLTVAIDLIFFPTMEVNGYLQLVVVTIDLHYLTDRQERFDLKISKLKILWKQRQLHLGCP